MGLGLTGLAARVAGDVAQAVRADAQRALTGLNASKLETEEFRALKSQGKVPTQEALQEGVQRRKAEQEAAEQIRREKVRGTHGV